MAKQNIKVGIIAPPFCNVPPRGQGGTERIVDQMANGFLEKGYEVVIFGAGEYYGKADFVPIFPKTISEMSFDSTCVESSRPLRLESTYIAQIMQRIAQGEDGFDIIFNHARAGYLFSPLSQFINTPIVSIMHLPIFQELANFLEKQTNPNVVLISDNQGSKFEKINYLDVVYNGVNLKEFEFNPVPDDYFIFMGALGEHKNPLDAILACGKAGEKIILAGGKKREPYFTEKIKPLIDDDLVKYTGEVSGDERIKLLKNAKALIFPIKWQEPFGLVMIEAMASGTPVIAYNDGAVSEVVEDGKTGFIVQGVDGIVEAMKNIDKINRKEARSRVEKYFSTDKMVAGYENIIKKLVKK